MTMDTGAAARLQHLVETRRQSPDSHGIYKNPEQAGVSTSWLAAVFDMDEKVVKAKLKRCPVKKAVKRGRTMMTVLYDIKEASRYLITPAISAQDVMRELRRGQLPAALQQSVWDALLKRQTWEERAGQLWRTERVREVLGSTFQSIKFTTQLWAETVERSTELSPKQRELIMKMSDTLLADIYEALVEKAKTGASGPQITEASDLLGENVEPLDYADLDDDTMGMI